MYEVKAICDRCKKEETQTSTPSYGTGPSFAHAKNGWKSIKLEISNYNYRHYLLCQDCQKELGLILKNENGAETEPKVETVADRLFNVISEIVSDQLPNE